MMSRSQRGGGQGFCDDITKAIVIKRVTVGEGGSKKCPKLRDVIYGRPLMVKTYTPFLRHKI